MGNYVSLLLGAATGGVAFAWMMYRIHRTQKLRVELEKERQYAAASVSSTQQFATESKPPELAHSR